LWSQGDFKIEKERQQIIHDVRKYYFIVRISPIWNSLPNWVVDEGDNINTLKAGLDKFWSDQEVLYDFTAEILSEPEMITV